MKKQKKGKFIVIYGVNNSGKTTQAKLLVKNLSQSGFKAEYVKYPLYNLEPSGPYINAILREGLKVSAEELQLWYVLNRHQYEAALLKKLENGVNIIAEDYVGTGLAWGKVQGCDEKWLQEINRFLVPEDLALLLVGGRFSKGKEKEHKNEKDEAVMAKCEKVHEELARELKWHEIDSRRKIAEVQEEILDLVLSFLLNKAIKVSYEKKR